MSSSIVASWLRTFTARKLKGRPVATRNERPGVKPSKATNPRRSVPKRQRAIANRCVWEVSVAQRTRPKVVTSPG